MRTRLAAALVLVVLATGARAATVVELVARVKRSILTITADRRDETKQGMGAGFAIGEGLVATNYHVIGQGRPIEVRTADGKKLEVLEVVAHDRDLDLAVLRVKPKSVRPLKLGDSDTLKVGQDVVAMGNPIGMEASVVVGVVSGRRRIEGREMIQVAIPIEHGNSGGPLLDMEGRVHGVVTLKSALTANLGFAVAVNQLKGLLVRQRPVPIARWIAQHAPDPAVWVPSLGARWRQRENGITVDGEGSGFGGRSLCTWQQKHPQPPCEVGVWIRMKDDSGAAGVFFLGESEDRHYAFYPSRGKLRLTRFTGKDFRAWSILEEKPSVQWRPGDWNHLKVAITKDAIQAYVNDELVIESKDREVKGLACGLVKFRDTRAEFRGFAVADRIAPVRLATELMERITKLAAGAIGIPVGVMPPVPVVDALVPEAPGSVRALRERARQLEGEAASLKSLARVVHERAVRQELAKLLAAPDDQVDLVHAALLVARLDADDLDIAPYRAAVDRMAETVAGRLPPKADEAGKLAALDRYLFEELGFHGSHSEYHSRPNSYLNQVIDEREGLPITLSVLYMELARRLGVKVVGVGLPGHFVVQHRPAAGEPQLIDPFEGARRLTRADADALVRRMRGKPARDGDFAPQTKKAIVSRMIQNLLAVAHQDADPEAMVRYLDVLIDLDPQADEERWTRAMLHARAGRLDPARADLDWLIAHKPENLDLERIQEARKALDR